MADFPNSPNTRHNRVKRLPQEITLNIFSRLPVESVLHCKLVCRCWRDLLQFRANTNYFAYQHLQRQHGCGLTYQQEQNPDGSHAGMTSFIDFDIKAEALYYAEYRDVREKPVYHRRRINLRIPSTVRLVCSCNGLICLSSPANYNGISPCISPREPSYICNPITREFVNLPPISIDKKKTDMGVHIIFGFGRNPLTNEFKVVRISYLGLANKGPPKRGMVEIYTLGSDCGWKSAGETNFFQDPCYCAIGVDWNGSLHWCQRSSSKVVAFDLADEKFHSVPNPPGQLVLCRLSVMGSWLCLITAPRYASWGHYDLWISKVNKEDGRTSRSWSKKLIMKSIVNDKTTLYRLFGLTKGRELLLQIDKKIILNNPTTRKVKTLWNHEHSNMNPGRPVSHINSFISLKALGEKNVEILRKNRKDLTSEEVDESIT